MSFYTLGYTRQDLLSHLNRDHHVLRDIMGFLNILSHHFLPNWFCTLQNKAQLTHTCFLELRHLMFYESIYLQGGPKILLTLYNLIFYFKWLIRK